MTVNAVMGEAQAGHYATSRRGSLDEYERTFIEQKVKAGLSDFAIAQMLQRPRDVVAWYRESLSITRGERPEYQSGHARKGKPANSNKPPRGFSFSSRAKSVLKDVARKHGVRVDDLTSASRKATLVRARWEAWSRIYDLGTYSLPQIGALFNRDHTTILYGIQRLKEEIHKQGLCVDEAQRTTREPESDSTNGGSI